MDIKALAQLMELSMLQQTSSDGILGNNQSSSLGGTDFSTLLQSLMLGNNDGDSTTKPNIDWVRMASGIDDSSDSDSNNSDDTSAIIGDNSKSYSSEEIDSAIKAASQKYGVDEDFIKAIIKQESGFQPAVVSKAGAQGLMQLMPSTAKALGVDNPFDAMQNVDGGTKYIKNLIDGFNGNKELALSAYNGGISRMNRRGIDTVDEISKMPKETQNYVNKVMKSYEKYKNSL